MASISVTATDDDVVTICGIGSGRVYPTDVLVTESVGAGRLGPVALAEQPVASNVMVATRIARSAQDRCDLVTRTMTIPPTSR